MSEPNRYQVAAQIATELFHGGPQQDHAKEVIADALGTIEAQAKREGAREALEIVHKHAVEWRRLVANGLKGYNSAGDAEQAIRALLPPGEPQEGRGE
jgi:hypothetical protein